jgi:hypothetical protein
MSNESLVFSQYVVNYLIFYALTLIMDNGKIFLKLVHISGQQYIGNYHAKEPRFGDFVDSAGIYFSNS